MCICDMLLVTKSKGIFKKKCCYLSDTDGQNSGRRTEENGRSDRCSDSE